VVGDAAPVTDPDRVTSPAPAPLLVGIDIDGTILDYDDRITETVREAVAETARHHHVVIATGRSVDGTLPVLDRLGLVTGFAVCANGAVTLRLDPGLPRGWEVDDLHSFSPAPVLRLIAEYLPTALYGVEGTDLVKYVSGAFPDGELDGELRHEPFEALMHRPALRVVVRSLDHTPEDFLELVERIGLHGVSYAVGWTAWLDIAPEGVTKATALEMVRQQLGVAEQATRAIGDGRNDVEMLRWAARSAAMGGAPEEVVAAATEEVPAVDGDGLAVFLGSVMAESGTRRAAG
jgi:hydroxymethylpyrimidine pyrophosphatase-like HAD family hydrolase